jgi:hypothetical protein
MLYQSSIFIHTSCQLLQQVGMILTCLYYLINFIHLKKENNSEAAVNAEVQTNLAFNNQK